jgi:hypothetical protein
MSARRAPQRFRRLRISGLLMVALANIYHYRGPGEYLALFCDPGDGQLMLGDEFSATRCSPAPSSTLATISAFSRAGPPPDIGDPFIWSQDIQSP